MADMESLDRVVEKALAAVEEGQEAIFSMAEAARGELEHLQSMLEAAAGQSVAVSAGEEHNSREKLELGRSNLVRVVEQAGHLLTRFGVALQCLRGVAPESESDGDWQPRKQVGHVVIRMLDNERRRIAREIHDGPAQTLTNLLLRTVFCEQRLAEEPVAVQNELMGLKDVIRGSLREIRKILFDLRPKDLDQGLIGGLRQLIDDYQERYGLRVMFSYTGQEQHLSGPAASALFRIVQEALNNVYKHSFSDHALVRLELYEHQVVVHIYDDGKGFDLQSVAQNNGHYGLMNMRERARLLGGSLQINTAPGQGTQISVTIPFEEGDEGLG